MVILNRVSVTLISQITDADSATTRQRSEGGMALAMNICRFVTGRRLHAEQVEFTHSRNENLEVSEKYFGSPVRFGALRDAITLRRSRDRR